MTNLKAKCVETGVYDYELTLGKVYNVIRRYEEENDDVLLIVDDTGEMTGYTLMHFEII